METWVVSSLEIPNAIAHLPQSLGTTGIFLAQNVRDPDVMGQMQGAFTHFVESGQIWALIIGLVIGYGFRSLLP